MSGTVARTVDHEGRLAKLEQIADDTRRMPERFDRLCLRWRGVVAFHWR